MTLIQKSIFRVQHHQHWRRLHHFVQIIIIIVIIMIIMESRQPKPKSTQVITIDISVIIIMESHTPQSSSSSNLLVLRPALQIFSAIQQSNTKLELPGLGDFSKSCNACIWTKIRTVFFSSNPHKSENLQHHYYILFAVGLKTANPLGIFTKIM